MHRLDLFTVWYHGHIAFLRRRWRTQLTRVPAPWAAVSAVWSLPARRPGRLCKTSQRNLNRGSWLTDWPPAPGGLHRSQLPLCFFFITHPRSAH